MKRVTVPCPVCAKDVSPAASVCPHCGEPNPGAPVLQTGKMPAPSSAQIGASALVLIGGFALWYLAYTGAIDRLFKSLGLL